MSSSMFTTWLHIKLVYLKYFNIGGRSCCGGDGGCESCGYGGNSGGVFIVGDSGCSSGCSRSTAIDKSE